MEKGSPSTLSVTQGGMSLKKRMPTPVWAQGRGNGYLLCVLLLDLLQVGSEVHVDLVLGAQEGPQHRIGGHAHPAQGWPLEFAPQVKELLAQVFQLQNDKMGGGRGSFRAEGRGFVRWTQVVQGGTKDGLETPLKDVSGGISPPW